MTALKIILIFAQVLKVVGPDSGLQTHSMKHYREFLGWPSPEDYEIARKRIVAGDTGASINWQGEDVLFTLKADPERHRPELYVKILVQKNVY